MHEPARGVPCNVATAHGCLLRAVSKFQSSDAVRWPAMSAKAEFQIRTGVCCRSVSGRMISGSRWSLHFCRGHGGFPWVTCAGRSSVQRWGGSCWYDATLLLCSQPCGPCRDSSAMVWDCMSGVCCGAVGRGLGSAWVARIGRTQWVAMR